MAPLATTAINDEHEMAYRRAIYLSALQNDLERMPAGDATEIGEKCINLSGGQKARANLAHALSSDASVLLMDDILAAVDAHVAALLFHACIKSSLHGKARVLVTHSLSNAAQCNYIPHR
ncbi:ATP-binding cassette sub- C member 8 [Allomyces arbusculus]|nr:ATP-binding cassette sub- C member 8 [Allomyces arbusculus]